MATGLTPYNESLRTIAIYRSDLQQKVNKYNNFQIDLTGIPNFDGTGESAWHFINAIKVIAPARRWPLGNTGADTLIGAEGTYGEVIQAATGGGETPFSTDIDANTTTLQQKADGLAKRQPWNLIAYTAYAQPAAGANGVGLNGSPSLAQASRANPALDGYEIIEGTNTLGDGTAAQVRSSYPRAIGKFANAAPGDGTTFANGPVNDCSRSRRLIEALKTKFVHMGRNWLLTHDTLENIENFPRTLYSHRFTGQRAKANGRYGFIDLIEDQFLPKSFQQEKFRELKQLTFANYPLPVGNSGLSEKRNMRTFTWWYKTCLGIAGMVNGYGLMINQKAEFYEKIPIDIITKLNDWEVFNGRQFTNMEEVYEKAIEIETSQMNVTMSSHILPFTGQTNPYWQNQRGLRQGPPRQNRPYRRRTANYIEVEDNETMYILGKDLANMNIRNINNIQSEIPRKPNGYGFEMRGQQFGRNRNFIGQAAFRNQRDNRCYTCGEKGHFAVDCPRNSRSRPRTNSMNRSRSRTRKTQEQNQRQRSSSRNRQRNNSRNRQYRQRSSSRNRQYNQQSSSRNNRQIEQTPDNINYRNINHVQYEDELYTPGYIQSNYPDNYVENIDYDNNFDYESIYDDYHDDNEYDDYHDDNNNNAYDHHTNNIYNDEYDDEYDYNCDNNNHRYDDEY